MPTRISPDDPWYDPSTARTMYRQRFVITEDDLDDEREPSVPLRGMAEDDEAEAATGAPTAVADSQAPTTTATPSVGRSSAIMALGSLTSRMLGFVRNFLFAQVVLASVVGDAFNVANTMPNYLLMVLNAGVLNAVLIPQITAAMKMADGGRIFVDKLLTAAIGAIVALTVVGTLATPWLIERTSDFSGSALRLSILFGYICLPQILFYGLYSVLGNVLNARDRFGAFMWAPALANVVQIGGLAAFLHLWGRQTDPSTWTMPMVWMLAGSTTLGIAVQALVLVPPLWASGFRYRPRWGLRGSGLGAASKMVGWTLSALLFSLAGGLVVQWVFTSVVRRAVAGGPPVGGITSYNYAMLIFALPHGLVTVSILTALFPQMARTWQAGDVRGMRRLVTRALCSPAVAIIPSSVGLFVLAEPLVHVLLRLPPASAQPVVTALRILSFGILGYGISVLQQRYCFAREEGRHNFLYQGLLTVLQVAFALVAWAILAPHHALPVIALGVVVANWAQSLVWMFVARRQLGGLDLGRVARLWTRLLLASLFAGVVAALVLYGMSDWGSGWFYSLLMCAVAGTAFVVDFWLAARIFRIGEVDDLLAPVARRLRRG